MTEPKKEWDMENVWPHILNFRVLIIVVAISTALYRGC